MKVAGNKLKHLQDFYLAHLKDVYEEAEIRALFEISVGHFLGYTRSEVLLKKEENVNQSDLLKLYDCAKALQHGEPLQYILKEAWFYNQRFYVDGEVLIPRPETEELVDLILKENKSITTVLDIGTGSGCIPITLKKQRPAAEVFACDISQAALEVAARNAKQLDTAIEIVKADALSPDFTSNFTTTFEIIVSNPPYIKATEAKDMSAQVLEHEPHLALFAEGEDESIFYKKIISDSAVLLQSGGKIYFELNPLTATEVRDYAVATSFFSEVQIVTDMSGKLRFMRLIKL